MLTNVMMLTAAVTVEIDTRPLARTIHESSAAADDIRKNTGRAPSRCSTYCSVRLRAFQSAPPCLFEHLVTLATNLHE